MITDTLFILVGIAIAGVVAAFYLHYHTAKAVAVATKTVAAVQADVAVLKAKV
jgi:hypothetical protein